MARRPGALPLLSFAMSLWWEARDDATHTLPAAAWRSLGGLAGALTRHADHVLDAMSEEERRAADQLLVRLVSAERTRARVARALLLDTAAAGPHAPRALERLVDAKLVMEVGDQVELAHEALITQWPRLRALIVSSGEDRAFRERVAAAARQWDVQGRPQGALWSDEQAIRLARWFAATNAPLDQLELSFVVAVKRRASRRRIIFRTALASVVLAALTFGLVATANEHEMEKRLRAATERASAKERAYVHSESRRLEDLAAANLERDPTAALRMADASYELEHESSLDVLAWDARARGVAVPLPAPGGLAPGGMPAPTVVVAPQTGFIAATSGGSVIVISPNSRDHASFRATDDPAGAPRAMAFSTSGEMLIVGASTGELSVAHAPAFARESVARCTGAVRRIWVTSGAAFFAQCSAGGGAAQVLWVDPRSKAARPVFEGSLGGTSFASDLHALILVTPDGQRERRRRRRPEPRGAGVVFPE